MNIEQMLEEEKALEAKMFGTPDESKAKDTEATTEVKEDATSTPEETKEATEVVKEPVVEPEPKKREDWKKRYTNLRASRDEKLFKAQADLADALRQITTLQHQVQELSTKVATTPPEDPFKDLFTEEESEALGETAVEAMKKAAMKAAEAKTAKLEKELANAQKDKVEQAKLRAQQEAKNSYDTFLNRLSQLVPNWKEVDKDPAFMKYLGEQEIDGATRLSHFQSAEQRGDVATVARYMTDYSKKPKESKKEDALEEMVAPTGKQSATNSQTEKEDVLTMAQINEHYEKHARGGYKGRQKEFQEMEDRIDAAVSAGLVRG